MSKFTPFLHFFFAWKILWARSPDMLTNSSAMVTTEALYCLFSHKQLDFLVVLLWRLIFKVSPTWTSCCFPSLAHEKILKNFDINKFNVLQDK